MIVNLGDVAHINPRLSDSLHQTEPVSFVPMASLSAEDARVVSTETRTYSAVSKGYTPFRSGDILVAKITPCFENGKIAQAHLPLLNGFGSTEFHVIRPRDESLDGRYLHHFLRQEYIRVEGERRMTGSGGQRRVPGSFLSGLRIFLPSLEEQRRIAAILDQADALRAKRREALAQLDELEQAIFIEMFGDPGLNPKGWGVFQLGEVIAGKPNNGIFKKNDEYGDGLPVVWVEELFRGNSIDIVNSRRLPVTTKEIKQYGLRHGDVLFCRSSLKLAGLGFNNVYLGEDNKALFECHVIRVSPDKSKIVPVFLNFLLRMPSQRQRLFKFAKTVTMSTIDQEGLRQISLPVPPLEMQDVFASRLAEIDKIRLKHNAAFEELNSLFTSLQQRAFRGEL